MKYSILAIFLCITMSGYSLASQKNISQNEITNRKSQIDKDKYNVIYIKEADDYLAYPIIVEEVPDFVLQQMKNSWTSVESLHQVTVNNVSCFASSGVNFYEFNFNCSRNERYIVTVTESGTVKTVSLIDGTRQVFSEGEPLNAALRFLVFHLHLEHKKKGSSAESVGKFQKVEA